MIKEDGADLNVPDVSVVMSVYNDAAGLAETIGSILSQEGVSLEFVIVDDGSTDGSALILEEAARSDRRVKVIHQENQGLTRALIKGCSIARGAYIARQDAGDISLPGRLASQLSFINQHPNAAFVSCGTRFVGPSGEYLYDVCRDPGDATESLNVLELDEIQGPSSHPSTLFNKSLYEQVGGYRTAFYFAQDIDLWIRLAERGRHYVMPGVLYQTSVRAASISGRYRAQQVGTARLILESAKLRREGLYDDAILQQAHKLGPDFRRKGNRFEQAKALYFIGSCLRAGRSPQAAYYFRRAFLTCPLHFKAAVRLLWG